MGILSSGLSLKEHDLFHHLSKLSCTWLWMSPQNAFSDLSSYKDEQHLKQSKELKLKFKEVTQMSGVTLLPDFNKGGQRLSSIFLLHTLFDLHVRLKNTKPLGLSRWVLPILSSEMFVLF